MRLLIQRVKRGSVTIANDKVGEINQGYVLLVGIKGSDAKRDADYLIEKCLNMRIFPDDAGKFDQSILDVKGELLVISQFTLFADTRKGRRPGFSEAAVPSVAIPLYQYFIEKISSSGLKVACGEFGADMEVEIINDGPVTIMLDSEDKYPTNQEG